MSSGEPETSKDFRDGLNDGEQLAKWVVLRKLRSLKKIHAPNSSGGRVIKELEDYIGRPFNLIACTESPETSKGATPQSPGDSDVK